MQRRYRLRRREDFQRLRRDGRVLRHPLLMLSLVSNGLTHNRYGFVTTRQLGSAVVRNRVRRLLREAVRQIHPRIHPGFDLVIIARSDALQQQPFATISRIVSELCNRAGLMEDDQT